MPKNKGPLIAIAGAVVMLLLLLAISAIANLPQTAAEGNVWFNILALILICFCGSVALIILRERLASHPSGQQNEGETLLTLTDTPHQLTEGINALFGTTDMNQITTGIQSMYAELEELREGTGNDQDAPEDLTAKVSEQERIITALANERDQPQAASERWQAKAISSTQEVAELRQEMKEHGKWQPLTEAELASFFPTVTIKDGPDHNAFLNSKRRQRRLMQRLSAEGYSIVKKVK